MDREVTEIIQYVTHLAKFQALVQNLMEGQNRTPGVPLFEPGDQVLIKSIPSNSPTLNPVWEGPHTVILSSPTAVKVTGIEAWIHHSRIKAWKISSQDLPDNTDKEEPIVQSTKAQEPEYACKPLKNLNLLFKKKKTPTKDA